MSESEGDMPHAVGCEFRRCETCKHWGPLDPSDTAGYERKTDFGLCGRVRHDEDYLSSGQEPYKGCDESIFDEPAVVIDGSGYHAQLRTKADFCCCLWEG